jgi:hypothetical protein
MAVKKQQTGKIKKAQRKARARRALKAHPPKIVAAAPVAPKFNKHLEEENAKLHKTSAAIAYDARGIEKLMDRKRYSTHSG